MTTDPIAAARALLEPLTGYTPGPWRDWKTGYVSGPEQGEDGDFDLADVRLIAAAPDLRNMVATLADALEAERAKVAAAYEAAALFSESQRREGDSFYNDGWCACATVVAGGIRNITPADTQAALNKLLTQARIEGWRAGRDAATEPLHSLAAVLRKSENSYHQAQASAMLERVDAIRALPEPKEASNG